MPARNCWRFLAYGRWTSSSSGTRRGIPAGCPKPLDYNSECCEEMSMAVIEITPATTMEAILHAYPTAKVGLFQRYHIGGCDACSYRPNETLEDVRRNFNIKDSIEEI